MASNPALIHSVVGGLPNQLSHSGRGHSLAGALVTAGGGDQACAAVDGPWLL